MKTYKVKNYKGNLVESLSKFQKSHKGMKIVEACEDGDDLKIKAEESEKLEEASGKKVYCLTLLFGDEGEEIRGIFSSRQKAQKEANILEERYSEDDDPSVGIEERTMDELWSQEDGIGYNPSFGDY